MWNKILGSFVLLSLAFAPGASAQTQQSVSKWWRDKQMSKELRLSPDMQDRLDKLFLTNRLQLVDLKGEVIKKRLELDNLLVEDPVDEALVSAKFQELEAARTKLAAERFRFIVEVRKLIGPDRFQELKTIFRKYRHQMHEGYAEGGS